ncbi:MAG: hypothetical protein AB9919_04070 [Geobacteraceae bacterium]
MKRSAIFAISIYLCFFLLGCQKKEGPAERLGKEIDKSVDDVGSKFKDALSDTEEKLGKATDNLKKSVDSFGDRIKKDSGNTDRELDDSSKEKSGSDDN